VRSSLKTASEEPYQHLSRRRDGSVFPVEVRARSLPHGDRTLRISAIRDVSERVEAEERQGRLEAELRQAAHEWRQTFDALDLGIVLADAEGRIVRLNGEPSTWPRARRSATCWEGGSTSCPTASHGEPSAISTGRSARAGPR